MLNSPSSATNGANQQADSISAPERGSLFHRVRDWQLELGLLALCLFLFFWRLGDAPLFDLDEALYVTCAQQMVVSDDWVTPRINTRQPERPGVTAIPFFEKPTLVYWASAGSMRVFGRNLWAARLPAALAALLTTFAIALFGHRRFTRRAGLFAGAIFAANPMTLVDARQMTTDGLLVLWFTLALFCFWEVQARDTRYEIRGNVHASRISYLVSRIFFWLFSALAILTKGIVGLLLPLLIIGVYLTLDRLMLRARWKTPLGPRLRFALKLHPLHRVWAGVRRLRPFVGLLLLLVVAAPWHLRIVGSPERDAQGRTWVMEYIQRQHIGRFKGLDTVHNQPLPTYFVYFLLFFFPWAGFTPAAFRNRKEEKEKRRKGEEEKIRDTRYEIREGEDSSFILPPSSFLLTWFWTLFVFFSLGAAKLPTYIAPAYPAAALLVGRWLDAVLSGQGQEEQERKQPLNSGRSLRRGALCALFIGLLLLCALPIAPRFVPPNAPLPVGVIPLAWHLALTLTLGSALAWFCFRKADVERQALGVPNTALITRNQPPTTNHQPLTGIGALIAMMGVVVAILGSEGYGVLHNSVLGPYQQVARDARSDAAQGIPVVYFNIIPRRPSMNFYAGYAPFEHKEVPLLPFLVRCVPPGGREADVVLTYNAYTRLLTPEIGGVPGASAHILQQRGPNGEWALVRVTLPPNYNPLPDKNLPTPK